MDTSTDPARRFRAAAGEDLMAARRRRDRRQVRVIGALLAAVDNAEAVDVEQRYDYHHPGHGDTEVPRRRLDRDTLVGLLTNEIRERRDAAATYRRIGQDAAADELDRECEAIEPYLRSL